MNISIKRRIYYSFSLLVFLFMISGLVTLVTLSAHKKSTDFVASTINPSIQSLTEFKQLMIESKMYSTSWVFQQRNENDKGALIKIHTQEYPAIKGQLNELSTQWVEVRWRDTLQKLFVTFDHVIASQKKITQLLKLPGDYNNISLTSAAGTLLEKESMPNMQKSLDILTSLTSNAQKKRMQQEVRLLNSSRKLRVIILVLALATTCIGLFLSLYFARIIVNPIKKIRKILNDLGRGNIQVIDNSENNDEIGEMVHSVNMLSKNLWQTATFAHEVGARNFDIPFKPLSDEDTLGKALVAMRDDLKNSEQELLKANREFEILFHSIDEVFFSIDMVNLKVIQVSKACEKLYGYPASAFLNDHLFWLKLIHPDDKHTIENEYTTLFRGEKIVNQYRIVRSDNEKRWVENKISATLNESGELIRLDGVTRDITDRKVAEEEFRKSEERYRQIVETAQEGIWMIDEENKTVFVNKKMGEILGYTQEEMIGRTNLSFKDEKGRIQALENIQHRKKGKNESHESTFLTKSGKLVYVHVNTNPILDEKGSYGGALAMMTDITQRKLDEELLKKSEANLRTIFDNTDIAYVLINDAFEIVSFNGLAASFSDEQARRKFQEGTPILDYFPDERQVFLKKVMETVKRGETVDYEVSYNQANGSKKWYEVRWLGVTNREKKNWGYIVTTEDITEEKLARMDREKVTADLIHRNKDLQQFTYIVSHNLRAPVANIMGISDLLNITSGADLIENKNLLTGLSASVKQLDNIIIDLNEILKVRNPGSESKEKVSFPSLVADIKSSINHIVDKEHAVINYDFSEADHAFTLKTYMYSIFYNLIVNSIKYKQPSVSPLIEIKGTRCDKKVQLLFKDNGKGIDMQKNGADIFMLYKRFDTTVEGKGIGLYMVKTAVETLGGTISLNSQVNKGTEFKIEIPLLN